MSEENQQQESQDDAIIGLAFKRSLYVIAIIAVIIVAVVLFNRERPVTEESQPAEIVLPEIGETKVTVPSLPFTDMRAASGITYAHFNGARGDKMLPETMGGGVALFDYDNDGDADLLFVNGADWPETESGRDQNSLTLYRNDGGGTFTDVTSEVGLDSRRYGMGVAVGDVDGNGWEDLYITAVGANQLFLNQSGTFTDATQSAGVAGSEQAWSTGAGFFDMDNDGDLDLFVCNYVQWSREIDIAVDFQLTGVGRAYGPPTNFQGDHSVLYRNDGQGRFTDVSAAAGIQVANPATGAPMGKALAIAPVDFDRDGWIDIMVANDTVQNFLFHNQGDGTFVETGATTGMAFDRNGNATGAMGLDSAYYRNDDQLGLAIGNFANEMTSLYVVQEATGQFADEAIGEGIGPKSRAALTFGLLFLDVDLDGRLDMVQTNGHLEEEINTVQASQHYRQPAQLFWNTGNPRTFALASETGDLATPIVGRGAASADLDGDGDQDIVLTQINGPPLLLRNDQTTGRRWLHVNLRQSGGNPRGIGAWVQLTLGGKIQQRQIMPTCSYLSQVPPVAVFGLGNEDLVDELAITWPDGHRQVIQAVKANQVLLVERN